MKFVVEFCGILGKFKAPPVESIPARAAGAVGARDAALAERVVRGHTLNLASHVAANVDYLD